MNPPPSLASRHTGEDSTNVGDSCRRPRRKPKPQLLAPLGKHMSPSLTNPLRALPTHQRTNQRAWATLVVLLTSALFSGPASAQDSQRRVRARQLFQQGVDSARQENWAEAHAAFDEAYEQLPNPTILVNLAAAQKELGHLAESFHSYQFVLRDEESSSSHRELATRQLAVLEPMVPRLNVAFEGWQPNDEVELDGQVLEDFDAAAAIRVNPGTHEVAVRREHQRVGITRVRVSLRETTTIRIPLPTIERPRDSPPDNGTPGRTRRGALQLSLGSAALASSIGLGTTVLVGALRNGSCANTVGDRCEETWNMPRRAAIGYVVAGGVVFALGVGLIAAGVRRRRSSARSWAIDVGIGTVSVSGSL